MGRAGNPDHQPGKKQYDNGSYCRCHIRICLSDSAFGQNGCNAGKKRGAKRKLYPHTLSPCFPFHSKCNQRHVISHRKQLYYALPVFRLQALPHSFLRQCFVCLTPPVKFSANLLFFGYSGKTQAFSPSLLPVCFPLIKPYFLYTKKYRKTGYGFSVLWVFI